MNFVPVPVKPPVFADKCRLINLVGTLFWSARSVCLYFN